MKLLKNISFTVIISVILVLVAAFCICGTVLSQSDSQHLIDEKYYRAIEQTYLQEVRTFLEEEGYRNSGVMMTKVIEADGSRSYTVTINHGRIDRLSIAEQQSLLAGCSSIDFPVEGCAFSHTLLNNSSSINANF